MSMFICAVSLCLSLGHCHSILFFLSMSERKASVMDVWWRRSLITVKLTYRETKKVCGQMNKWDFLWYTLTEIWQEEATQCGLRTTEVKIIRPPKWKLWKSFKKKQKSDHWKQTSFMFLMCPNVQWRTGKYDGINTRNSHHHYHIQKC